MEFREFEARVTVTLSEELSALWRERYVGAFVDTTTDYFRKYVGVLENHPDGVAYEGYLWDCMKHISKIPNDIFLAQLSKWRGRVMTMWDLHSADKIPVPNYWKFRRDAVLVLESGLLSANLVYLPEDVYIFDEELTRTLVATHEYDMRSLRIFATATASP